MNRFDRSSALWKIGALFLGVTLFGFTAQAATKYVIPGGAGTYSGADWDNAYSNIQQAVDACAGEISTNCLKSGVYTNFSMIGITNHPGLTIVGGYLGDDGTSTNLDTNTPTVVTRSPSVTNRILYVTNSTLTLNRLTVTDGLLAGFFTSPTNAGAGLYLLNCQTTITNCAIRGNGTLPWAASGHGLGIGISASGGALGIFNSDISGNNGSVKMGGGVYAINVSLILKACTIFSNSAAMNINPVMGGGLYLEGGTALLDGCSILSNFGSGLNGCYSVGGGIYATGVNPLTLTNCSFIGNYALESAGAPVTPCNGSALYIAGSGTNLITDCTLLKHNQIFNNNVLYSITLAAYEVVYLNTTGPTTFRNTIIGEGVKRGIYKQGSGSLTVTNSLIHSMGSHGIQVTAGTVSIANSTLANNGGWGLTNTSGTVTISDSIIWANAAGGVTGGTINAGYSDLQEPHAGAGNMSTNPQFAAGFYLATNGLPFQTNTSPCFDAGSASAESFGLDTRTTRTDGNLDQGTVDLGFHYASDIPDSTLSNLVLYVDVVNGNNGNNGWSSGNAKKNISVALTNAIDGTTIVIATGTYNTAAGETFPLAPQNVNLTLRGANRDTTLVNGGGATQVLYACAAGNLWLEALTFTNGSNRYGGGLYLAGCQTTITNCAIRGNHGDVGITGQNGAGVGVCVSDGTLGIFNSDISANTAYVKYGGGLYAKNALLTMKSSTIVSNWISNNANIEGGGLYLANCVAFLDGCSVISNFSNGANGFPGAAGGISAAGAGTLTLTNCTFSGNYTIGTKAGSINYPGSAMCIGDSMAAQIVNCQFLNNRNANPTNTEDIYVNSTGPVTLWNTVIGKGPLNGITKVNSGVLSLTNCLIYAEPCHGISIATGTVSIANTTIVGNGGWGLTNSAGTVSVNNSIVWGNTNGGLYNCTAAYSDYPEAVGGDGNINADPLFEGPATNNYRLGKGSPCINRGLNGAWMFSAVDLDGSPRINSKTVDMGAYEVQLPPSGTTFMCR